MDICKYVVQYGTGSTSMLLREMASRADVNPEHYEIINEIATKLEDAFSDLRTKGSCDCTKEFMK